MATSGGQPGNQNAAKRKIWRSVIQKRLEERAVIEKVADALIDKALTGDVTALNAIGDRLDGKPAQAIVGDKDHDPLDLDLKHTVEFVMPNGQSQG